MTTILLTILLVLSLPLDGLPIVEARTGKIVHYAAGWGDWKCAATEKCGIAARQGVTPRADEWCVAGWHQDDLGRAGILYDGARIWRIRVCDYGNPGDLPEILRRGIAAEIPYPLAQQVGITGGWTTGVLVLQKHPGGMHWRTPPAKGGKYIIPHRLYLSNQLHPRVRVIVCR